MDVDEQVDVIGLAAEFHQRAAPGGQAICKRFLEVNPIVRVSGFCGDIWSPERYAA
jgi:hypothetical protein